MKFSVKLFLLLCLILGSCNTVSVVYAQPAPQSSTLTAPPPPPITQLSLTVVGPIGPSVYFYYVVAHYPIGAVVSNGFQVIAAPTILTSINYVRVNWNPLPGATTYDILRTPTPGAFNAGSSGSCTACIVVTGLTTNTYNDFTIPSQGYTLTSPIAASVRFILDNTSHSTPYLTLESIAGPTATFNIQMPVVCVSGCSGAGSTPGGSTNDIQWNNGGSFAGGRCTMDSQQDINCNGTITAIGNFVSNTPGGTASGYTIQQNSTVRATLFANTMGTTLEMGRYDNSGTFLDDYLTCIRGTGDCIINHNLTINGTCTGCGSGTPGGSTNDIQFNSAGSFAGGRCTMDSSQNIACIGTYSGTQFIGTDTAHSALMYLKGLTSGGVALGVDDVAGTAITYVLPSTNGSAGQVLSDNGLITCPTFQTGGPTVCHQLTWIGVITTIASGTASLGTGSITGNACASTVTVSATGVAATDSITWTPNADISGVTGYGAQTTDGLKVYPWPTTNNVNFKVCNGTTSSITPGAVTLNFRVLR